MNKEQLWNIYTQHNPQFLTEEYVTLSSKGIKKLFDQTYSLAYEQGVNSQPKPHKHHTATPF